MKAVNVDEVLKILWKYGEFIFVTDNKKYSDMVNEIANLKDVEQEPSEDCISRQAVIEYIEGSDAELGHSSENELVCQDIKELPPVTPTQAPILDKIRAEIERQEKWLFLAGYTAYNVDIAFASIKVVLAESEGKG